jgi:iron complex outermembrane receptor protein
MDRQTFLPPTRTAHPSRRQSLLLLPLLILVSGSPRLLASLAEPTDLKKLTLRELMDVEVTTVARRPAKLSETAAAVRVITADEIRRSGATTLAEALRLAGNLQIAQVNAHDWAITARGFNGAPLANYSLANKLLVMIDSRSVYTPLFGGVFWDVQQVALEDVDRIEIVSGPGGTLWGANAVNGVINVVTKNAADTQGAAVTVGAGSDIKSIGTARYGGAVGEKFFYRVYGQRSDRGSTVLPDGRDGGDEWLTTQGGFRLDFSPTATDTLTLQGDAYKADENRPRDVSASGENLLARWQRTLSAESDVVAQVYIDHTQRDLLSARFSEDLLVADIDLQHRFPIGTRHDVIWGGGYRHLKDHVQNSASITFRQPLRNMELFSGFVQDEISFDGVKVTVGTKFEYNDFSGMEIQPSARLAWFASSRNMVWAAASRAVRSPSRVDSDIVTRSFQGDPDFRAETVVAWELGYRVRAGNNATASVTAFLNDYDDVRSIDLDTTNRPPLSFANSQRARTAGAEIGVALQPHASWSLRADYTFLDSSFRAVSPRVVAGSDVLEANDPKHQLLLHSIHDLPGGFELDLIGRSISGLPSAGNSRGIGSYAALDARVGKRIGRWEVSVAGKNLADESHAEFASSGSSPREIPRSVYASLRLEWPNRNATR